MLRNSQVLFVCHDNDRGVTVDGLPYSQLLDSLSDQLGLHDVERSSFASRWSMITGNRAYGSPFSANRAYAFAWLKDKALGITWGVVRSNEKHQGVASNRHRRGVFRKVLETVRPRLLVVIGADPFLMRAAKDLRIRSVELLHGYRYVEIPWGYEKREPEELPEEIWALDDISARTFSELKDKGVEIRRVSNPWYDSTVLRRGNLNSRLDAYLKSKSDEVSRALGKKEMIVVGLTWGYESGGPLEGEFPNGVFPDELEEVIRRNPQIVFAVRPHPVQLRDSRHRSSLKTVENLIEDHDNVLPIEISMAPLPLVLEYASSFITTASGAAAEAIEFGLPVLILDNSEKSQNFRKAYIAEIKDGSVSVWDGTEQQLHQWVGARDFVSDLSRQERQMTIVERLAQYPSAANLVLSCLVN